MRKIIKTVTASLTYYWIHMDVTANTSFILENEHHHTVQSVVLNMTETRPDTHLALFI
jgi:hypothetical protein